MIEEKNESEIPIYFSWSRVPSDHRTRKQWLKRLRRLKKDAAAVGTITLIFDQPRERPKWVEPVSAADCERLRSKLKAAPPDAADQFDLRRLDRAGQLVTMNLYDRQDTEEITCFTEPEAEELLGYMLWDGSHDEHYITEKPETPETERERRTWKWDTGLPDFKDHLAGERFFGHKKGKRTMQVTLDGDRHGGTVPGEQHITWAFKVGEVLTTKFPEFRFAPEINAKNGSVKFFGWLPECTPMPLAEKTGERLRAVLQGELPQYDFSHTEIFPSSSPQIFAPLRADKIMVIGDGVVQKVERYRMPMENGTRKRRNYEAYSCAAYLNWVYFSDSPFNAEVFERNLREAVARCPVTPATDDAPQEEKRTGRKKKTSSGTGMGSIGELRGRCAPVLVNFWSELEVPENDTIGKYLIVTLRVLRYEGLTSEEAIEWIEERLQAWSTPNSATGSPRTSLKSSGSWPTRSMPSGAAMAISTTRHSARSSLKHRWKPGPEKGFAFMTRPPGTAAIAQTCHPSSWSGLLLSCR